MSLPGRLLEVNGIRLHVHDQGSGPPVLLLHGFPDSSSLWRHQVPALVAAGYRVIAPDLRGFGESDKPAAVDAYVIPTLLGDAVGLLDALAHRARPRRLPRLGRGARLGAGRCSCPTGSTASWRSPSATSRSFFDAGLEQREKSWYMLYFQYEGIAEDALRENDWKLFRDWTRNHPELATWIPDLSRPGALHRRAELVPREREPGAARPRGHGVPAGEGAARSACGARATPTYRGADDRVEEVRRRANGATRGSKARATGSCSTSRSG